MPWYLSVCFDLVGKATYLSVYLFQNNVIDKKDTWAISTDYEIRLLNTIPVPGGYDVVRFAKDKEFKKSEARSGWGFRDLISLEKLLSGSFIQNDTIRIRIRLATKNFRRNCIY